MTRLREGVRITDGCIKGTLTENLVQLKKNILSSDADYVMLLFGSEDVLKGVIMRPLLKDLANYFKL